MLISKLNKISFLLLSVISFFSYADDYKLSQQEIELLKKAATLTTVEPWNPKKEWPSIINDNGTFDYGDKVPHIKQNSNLEIKSNQLPKMSITTQQIKNNVK